MSVILSLLTSFVWAQSPPQSFAYLKKIDIDGNSSIYVDPSVDCKPFDVNEQEGLEEIGYQGPPVYDVCTLEMGKGNLFKVIFSEGPSADPYFEFHPLSKKGKPIPRTKSTFGMAATTLYIPKGTSLYAEGWTNSMFNLRRKFSYDGTGWKEVKQPFYYVGLKSKVKKVGEQTHLQVYADKNKNKKVAVLPAGSDIEVLLCDDKDWYLIRSSFGLVGWVFVAEGLYDTQIGVRFAGD